MSKRLMKATNGSLSIAETLSLAHTFFLNGRKSRNLFLLISRQDTPLDLPASALQGSDL